MSSSSIAALRVALLPPTIRGVFAGAGSDGLNEPAICEAVLSLCDKAPAAITLAYLGTATYDLDTPRVRQTQWFAGKGVRVVNVAVGHQESHTSVDKQAAVDAIDAADVVVVSGGNTLYAVSRWVQCGIDVALRRAMERGAVLCGGSAGAICWFDAGHSDSLDPDTFREAMLAPASTTTTTTTATDESSTAPTSAADAKQWKYCRVSCLGLLPGLVCPHHDKTQSNGVPRKDDFVAMLQRHPGERGVGIDHWAALVVRDAEYSVVSLDGKPGSVAGCAAGDAANVSNASYVAGQAGIPGVWTYSTTQGGDDDGASRVRGSLAPWTGTLFELLKPAATPTAAADPLEEVGRQLNPA